MDYAKTLDTIRSAALRAAQEGAPAEEVLQTALGRKGALTALLRTLKDLPLPERQKWGQAANALKRELEETFAAASVSAGPAEADPTVPPLPAGFGSIHPITAMVNEMSGIFRDLSFEVVEGNELVTDQENFESLNIGKDHPVRDGHESFFVTDSILLRTQTTSVQVKEMAKRAKAGRLPIRIVMPGKTYRRESDPTHSPMFHQIDAVLVDSQTTFSDLKGILQYLAQRLFGEAVETRFRPHHFPFTEPSAELDIRRKEPGRRTEEEGWLEMGGCGMIHPEVLKRAGINPRIYQGWAFGMSIERPVMVRHGIKDLRPLFQNNMDLLNQLSILS